MGAIMCQRLNCSAQGGITSFLHRACKEETRRELTQSSPRQYRSVAGEENVPKQRFWVQNTVLLN